MCTEINPQNVDRKTSSERGIMKYHRLITPGLIFLIAIAYLPVVLAAASNNPSIYQVELFDLKKRGKCDSTKYTITNLDSQSIIPSHSFLNDEGQEVYGFTSSSISPGETRTYDLSSMDALPPYFIGDLRVTSTGEISGAVLPFPPCDLSIECSPELQNPGEINTIYTCKATVTPPDLLLPLTIFWYEWDAAQEENRIIGIGQEVALTWTTTGWHQFYVAAENPVGSITRRFLIYIDGSAFYLPILIK
jgi:hypothetical protein